MHISRMLFESLISQSKIPGLKVSHDSCIMVATNRKRCPNILFFDGLTSIIYGWNFDSYSWRFICEIKDPKCCEKCLAFLKSDEWKRTKK